MQVGVDKALAAADVVDTADQWVASIRQREARLLPLAAHLLLRDGADAFVAKVTVKRTTAYRGKRERVLNTWL